MSISKDKALLNQAKRVIASEMRSYDLLSRPARIVYERAVSRAIDANAMSPTYTCGHGVMLYEPCDKCTRTLEECEVYRRDAMRRVKELLEMLK